jgi:putative membrane protein insertion efficiency factor
MKDLSVLILKFYKKTISPIMSRTFGDACRFTPSCSEYTIDALEKYGFIKGSLKGITRFFKCNPWGGHGFDPVN